MSKTHHLKFQLLAVIGSWIATSATIAAGQEASKADTVEFHGYWRAGYQTDISLLGEPRSQQGVGQFDQPPTSRHVSAPSFLWLQLLKKWEGMEAGVRVAQNGNFVHENATWSDADANIIVLRDLYLQLPLGDDRSVWAGSRQIEYEDVRIFDYLNPFNLNAYGAGFHAGSHDLVISATKQELDLNPNKPTTVVDTTQGTATEQKNELLVKQKHILLHYRGNFGLSDSTAIKPMLTAVKMAGIPKDESSADTHMRTVGDNYSLKLGGVYSSWGPNFWSNTILWVESNPITAHDFGRNKNHDRMIGLAESFSYQRRNWGILLGLWYGLDLFSDAQPVYKATKNSIMLDGPKTTKNNHKFSFGVQPVLFLTKNVHLALDLNQTLKLKKISEKDVDSTLITPIIRYGAKKDTIGTPQIYTSVTYGAYDWKAKKGINGKPTDELMTTQTGFEIWF